jgi:hypothetical protein
MSSYHFVNQQPDHLVTAEPATPNPGPGLRGQVTIDARPRLDVLRSARALRAAFQRRSVKGLHAPAPGADREAWPAGRWSCGRSRGSARPADPGHSSAEERRSRGSGTVTISRRRGRPPRARRPTASPPKLGKLGGAGQAAGQVRLEDLAGPAAQAGRASGRRRQCARSRRHAAFGQDQPHCPERVIDTRLDGTDGDAEDFGGLVHGAVAQDSLAQHFAVGR